MSPVGGSAAAGLGGVQRERGRGATGERVGCNGNIGLSLQGSRMDEQRCSFPPPLKVGLIQHHPTLSSVGSLSSLSEGLGEGGEGGRHPPSGAAQPRRTYYSFMRSSLGVLRCGGPLLCYRPEALLQLLATLSSPLKTHPASPGLAVPGLKPQYLTRQLV